MCARIGHQKMGTAGMVALITAGLRVATTSGLSGSLQTLTPEPPPVSGNLRNVLSGIFVPAKGKLGQCAQNITTLVRNRLARHDHVGRAVCDLRELGAFGIPSEQPGERRCSVLRRRRVVGRCRPGPKTRPLAAIIWRTPVTGGQNGQASICVGPNETGYQSDIAGKFLGL